MKVFGYILNDWIENTINSDAKYMTRTFRTNDNMINTAVILITYDGSDAEIKTWNTYFYYFDFIPKRQIIGTKEEVRKIADEILIKADNLKAFI